MQYKENQFTLDLLEYIYNIKQYRYVISMYLFTVFVLLSKILVLHVFKKIKTYCTTLVEH